MSAFLFPRMPIWLGTQQKTFLSQMRLIMPSKLTLKGLLVMQVGIVNLEEKFLKLFSSLSLMMPKAKVIAIISTVKLDLSGRRFYVTKNQSL